MVALSPGDISDLVASLIRGVYVGAPSALEARRISQALVGTAWSAERGLRSELALGDAEHELEQILACIKAAAAIPGVVKVQQAKEWLRSHGERGYKNRVTAQQTLQRAKRAVPSGRCPTHY